MKKGIIEKNGQLQIHLDISTLNPAQVRLLKKITTSLQEVVTSEEEYEFFEGSAELMKLCGQLIQQAQFVHAHQAGPIPYAKQALEFSIDHLTDSLHKGRSLRVDN